jgi:signal transduction histidine kinase
MRLHQSIAQINIILKDATVEWEESLAELRVQGREDLTGLRERVEKVVDRMRQVTAELDVARRETQRSERLAAVGELAAGIAHELRNPLTSVKLLLQNASQQPGDARLREDESRVVLEEISRMEHTIQGLLDFSRPPSVQRLRHDFRDTLRRALNLIQGRARQQGIHIAANYPSEPLIVDGDPEQLHQVCVNLLINGVEAMPSGGTLEVQTEIDPARNGVVVRFRDHGPGIPSEVLEHMFEPFVSTKVRGTGLGLAISRRIVMQHEGVLQAHNDPGGGAVLTLELPLTSDDELRKLLTGPGGTPVASRG